MRGFDRDLIRGGHYGQRSCEPHLKAEHMAAPTNAANVKKALANSEPSTHGTDETHQSSRPTSVARCEADLTWAMLFSLWPDPTRAFREPRPARLKAKRSPLRT